MKRESLYGQMVAAPSGKNPRSISSRTVIERPRPLEKPFPLGAEQQFAFGTDNVVLARDEFREFITACASWLKKVHPRRIASLTDLDVFSFLQGKLLALNFPTDKHLVVVPISATIEKYQLSTETALHKQPLPTHTIVISLNAVVVQNGEEAGIVHRTFELSLSALDKDGAWAVTALDLNENYWIHQLQLLLEKLHPQSSDYSQPAVIFEHNPEKVITVSDGVKKVQIELDQTTQYIDGAVGELHQFLLNSGVFPENVQIERDRKTIKFIEKETTGLTVLNKSSDVIKTHIIDFIRSAIKGCTWNLAEFKAWIFQFTPQPDTSPTHLTPPSYVVRVELTISSMNKYVGTILRDFQIKAEHISQNNTWILSVRLLQTDADMSNEKKWMKADWEGRQWLGRRAYEKRLKSPFEGGLPGAGKSN